MKNVVRGSNSDEDKVASYWLESDGDNNILIRCHVDGVPDATLCSITKHHSLRVHPNIPTDFQTDDRGRLIVHDEDGLPFKGVFSRERMRLL